MSNTVEIIFVYWYVTKVIFHIIVLLMNCLVFVSYGAIIDSLIRDQIITMLLRNNSDKFYIKPFWEQNKKLQRDNIIVVFIKKASKSSLYFFYL